MKIFGIPKKTAVQVVVALIVIAALLGRDYPRASLVLTLCTVGFYLVLTIRRTGRYLLHAKTIDAQRRILAVTGLCIFYIFVRALIAGSVFNVLLLILLGVDYFVYDRYDRRNSR